MKRIFGNRGFCTTFISVAVYFACAGGALAAASVTSINVASQSGAAAYGTAGSVTFPNCTASGGSGSKTVKFGIRSSTLPAGASCTPVAVSGNGSWTFTLTVSTLATTPAGTYSITVTNDLTTATTGAGTLTIGKATPTLSVVNSPVTYDGSAQAATVNGSVAGTVSSVKYGGSSTVPTTAGTYAITANFTPTDTANYNSLAGASAGNFAINAAASTTAASAANATYSAGAQNVTLSATVTSAAGTVNEGTVTFTVKDGGTTVGTATTSGTVSGGAASVSYALPAGQTAKSYTIQAVYNAAVNYATSTDSSHSLTINAAASTTAASTASVTYKGSAQNVTLNATVTSTAGTVNEGTVTFTVKDGGTTIGTATTSGTVSGGAASVSYALPAGQTAKSYTIQAVYNTAANYTTSTDSAQSLTIGRATPTLSVGNSPVTYNGSAQAATVSGSVAGTVSNVKYDGSATVPATAGTYTVTADFAPTDSTDYSSLTGASAGNFVIEKAMPTLSVGNSPVTYTGSAQAATVNGSVAGTVSNVKYDGSATVPTTAGTYTVTADFAPTDSTDYSGLAGAPAGNFVIQKATPTVTVTVGTYTYSGSPQGPNSVTTSPNSTGTVTYSYVGTGGTTYGPSATRPTGAGSYTVTATVAADAIHSVISNCAFWTTVIRSQS